jgi:hypothetical protein
MSNTTAPPVPILLEYSTTVSREQWAECVVAVDSPIGRLFWTDPCMSHIELTDKFGEVRRYRRVVRS